MSVILKRYKGESTTFGFVLPDDYNLANMEDVKVYVGSNVYPHTMDNVRTVKAKLTSEDTQGLTGRNSVIFHIDDAVFGIRKILVGEFQVDQSCDTFRDDSVNTGYDVLVMLKVEIDTIAVDAVLYDVAKGDKGDSAFKVWQSQAGNEGKTEQDFFDYLQEPAVTAADAANEAASLANQRAGEASQAAILANTEAGQANSAALAANSAAGNANAKAGLANDAAILANTKAGEANQAAIYANGAGDLALLKAGLADGAANNANSKANEANLAATAANEAADLANDAANNADTKAGEASQAAIDANQATIDANDAIDNIASTLALKVNTTDIEQVRSQATNKVASSKLLDDELNTIEGLIDTLENRADAAESDITVNTADIRLLENTLNSANINQETTATVSGVDTVLLPKTAANTGMQVQLFGQSAENLVVNGDFRNGISGWSAGGSTNSAANGILTNTANGNAVEPNTYSGIGAKIIGNKYYLRANVTTKSALCTRIRILSLDIAHSINSPIVNNPYMLSGVLTASTTYNFLVVYHLYNSTADATGASIEVDNVMAINLTATFGAGNEPTKEQCDLLFANYFEGSDNVLGTGRIRSVNSAGLLPSYLYFNGGQLRSNGLTKDEIRKGTNGYELIQRINPADGTVLTTPLTIPVQHAGLLNSNSNGTVYFEPIIADAGVYASNLAIQLSDYPIASFESILKYANGTYTELNTATAVIASGGLSFTHPDLASGDLVMFTYAYSKESIGRSMTLTHYDSRYVKADTANGKTYRIVPVVTNGVVSWTTVEV